MPGTPKRRVRRILVVDAGGTHVKVALSGQRTEVKFPSGPKMTPEQMVRRVRTVARRRPFDAVTIGYPGLVAHGRIVREPVHLGPGWIGYNFERRFRRPTRIINDAAMQALGSYRGGKMLFLGLGTGLGTAMIIDGALAPMELAHLPYKKGREYEEYVGEAALERLGRKKWQKEVFEVVEMLYHALEPDYIILGGGNVRKLRKLPLHAERGDSSYAIVGGTRLWDFEPDGQVWRPPARSTRRAKRGR